MSKLQIVTTSTVIIGLLVLTLTDLTLTSASPPAIVQHGATYVIQSVVENLILTANRHLFRKVGIRPGELTLQRFDVGNPGQFFDAIFVKGQSSAASVENDQPQLIWLASHASCLNSLTIHPFSTFPEKNFVSLVPVPGPNTNKAVLIRSSYVDNKCLQGQGPKLPVIYAVCDFNNVNQHFTAEFLYEAEKDTTNFLEASNSVQQMMNNRYF